MVCRRQKKHTLYKVVKWVCQECFNWPLHKAPGVTEALPAAGYNAVAA